MRVTLKGSERYWKASEGSLPHPRGSEHLPIVSRPPASIFSSGFVERVPTVSPHNRLRRGNIARSKRVLVDYKTTMMDGTELIDYERIY